MKKTILFAATAALMTSCLGGEAIEELTSNTDLTAPINVSAESDEWDVQTRSFMVGTWNLTDLNLFVYDKDGNLAAAAGGIEGSGSLPTLNLPIGKYQLRATVGMKPENFTTMPSEVQYFEDCADNIHITQSKNPYGPGYEICYLFVGEKDLDVHTISPVDVKMQMKRATANLKFIFTDEYDYTNSRLFVKLNHFTSIDTKTFSSVYGMTEGEYYVGMTNRKEGGHESYNDVQVICPPEGYSSDVTLSLVSGRDTLITSTIMDVPLERGKTTLIKGSLAKGTNKTQLEYEFDWKEGQTIHL